MTRPERLIEDIIARARREELSDPDRRRLQLAIQSSHETRLLYEAGRGFATEGSAQPDDDLLVSRVAERVAGIPRNHRSRRVVRTIGAALAGLCVASAAAAAGWILEQQVGVARHQNESSISTKQETTVVRPARVGTVGDAARDQAIAQPTVGSSDVGRVSPRATLVQGPTSDSSEIAPRRSGANDVVVAPSAENARVILDEAEMGDPPPLGSQSTLSDLDVSDAKSEFARASRLRRDGQSQLAIELYVSLARRFPGAPEASQARLAAAELLLQRGEPARALDSFRSCRDGGAAAEVLWGEARALRMMARILEERQVLADLLARFPESAYAEAARQRLHEGE